MSLDSWYYLSHARQLDMIGMGFKPAMPSAEADSGRVVLDHHDTITVEIIKVF